MIKIISHGFKYSRPEANFVFDVSYLANPWRDKAIREQKDEGERSDMILRFISNQPGVSDLVNSISNVLITFDNQFPDENILVAICCSAGEYRSPAIASLVSMKLADNGKYQTLVYPPNKNSKL